MVPGVASEEYEVTGLGPLRLACRRVDDGYRPFEDGIHLIRGENRSVVRRMAESAAGRQREHQRVQLVAGQENLITHAP